MLILSFRWIPKETLWGLTLQALSQQLWSGVPGVPALGKASQLSKAFSALMQVQGDSEF